MAGAALVCPTAGAPCASSALLLTCSATALNTLAQRPQRTWPLAFFNASSGTRKVVVHSGQRVNNMRRSLLAGDSNGSPLR
jgi:hypothetical protein